MKKKCYLSFLFFLIICIPFSIKLLNEPVFKEAQPVNEEDKEIKNNLIVKNENEEKSNSKFKYAIFDICQSFWNKSLYELLYSYQKEQGKLPWSYYFKLIKHGVSYTLGTLDPKQAYEDFLGFCKGANLQDVKKHCSRVWDKECKNFILKDAKNNFDECKKNKMITIVADSGIKELYNDLAVVYTFDYVCSSELEFKDGAVSGKLYGEPCSGKEKLRKVKDLIENKLGGSLKDAVFYANSHNDIPLLNEVGKPVIVNPNQKLKDYAKSKKWEILIFKDLVKN